MTDREKTKEQLVAELAELRQRLAAVEKQTPEGEDAAVRETEQHFRKVFQEGPLGIGLLSTDLHVRAVNRRLCDMLGYSEEELLALDVRGISHPDDMEVDRYLAERLLQDEIPYYTMEKRYVRSDGGVLWGQLTVSLMHDERGEPVTIIGMIEDVTQRKRAEEALQTAHDELERRVEQRTSELGEVNRRLLDTLESITEGFVSFDRDWRYTYVNQAAANYLRSVPESLIGRVIWDVFPEARRLRFYEAFHRAADEKTAVHFEEFYPDPLNGWYECHCYPSREGMVVYFRDTTPRKRAQEALQQSHDELATIYDGIIEGLVITDVETRRFVRANAAMCRMLGYSMDELLSASVEDIHPPEEVPEDLRRFQAAAEGRVSINEERPVLREDGSIFYADISGHRIVYDGRPCLLALFRDVTERRQAQEALARERRTLLHMLRASDHERQLISYDIHDGLAQQVAAAMMQFQAYDSLKTHHPEHARTAYDAGVQMLRQAHGEARRLVSGVRPPILDESGITAAIAHLVYEHSAGAGPSIEFHSGVRAKRLAKVLENAVYRIAQESLINALRHSGSDKVKVSLIQEDDRLHLEVQDWGVGFEVASGAENRFGLEGIRERTRLLGGKCSIESEPGKGTCVRVVLPIVPEA